MCGQRGNVGYCHPPSRRPPFRFPLPFTTFIVDDHAPRAVSAGMNECFKLWSGEGRANFRVWVHSDLGAFGQFQSVLYVNAQVAHRAVDLGMAEENLNGAEVASRLVDD
jgi:hypothetical protein